MDCHLYTSHSLALTVKLDLGNPTELGQNRCEVVFKVNNVTNAMSRTHQQACSWLFLLLQRNTEALWTDGYFKCSMCAFAFKKVSFVKLHAQFHFAKEVQLYYWMIQNCVTSPTVWNSIPPKGGRSLSTRMYCSFPWSGGTCQQNDEEGFIFLREVQLHFSLYPLRGTLEPQFFSIKSYATVRSIRMKSLWKGIKQT